jgi:hypothetical protein
MNIDRIVDELKKDNLVITPTDTVYGIMGDALSINAIKKVNIVKKRKEEKPLIILVDSKEMLYEYTKEISKLEKDIIDCYMPGKLTMLVLKNEKLSDMLTSDSPYVGVRIPDNEDLIKIIKKLDHPVFSTSANIAESAPITKVDNIESYMLKYIAYIEDGGKCINKNSSIIQVDCGNIKIIRDGEVAQKIAQNYPNLIRYDYSYEEVKINNIYGILYKPKKDGKIPIIIFSHELCHNHSSGISYAEYLASCGFAFYTFDFAGGSEASLSGNDMQRMSVLTEVNDLDMVLDNIIEWNFIDKKNIFLLGASQGALVTLLAAAKHKSIIKGMVLLYGGFLIPEMMHDFFKKLDNVPNVFSYLGWYDAGRIYVTDVWDMKPYEIMQDLSMPVLLIHGGKDKLVDIKYSIRANKSLKNSEFIVLPNAGHIFHGENLDLACKYIEEFLQKNIDYKKRD